MADRYIVVPESISLRHPRTREVLADAPKSFIDYAYEVWFNDMSISEKGPVQLRLWMKMIDKFDKYSAAGCCVVLSSEEYAMLKAVVQAPKACYAPLVSAQLLPFVDAVLDAAEKDPRPPVAPAELPSEAK